MSFEFSLQSLQLWLLYIDSSFLLHTLGVPSSHNIDFCVRVYALDLRVGGDTRSLEDAGVVAQRSFICTSS